MLVALAALRSSERLQDVVMRRMVARATGRTPPELLGSDALRVVPSYHTTVVDAAREATEAGVPLLVLSHVVPPVGSMLAERIFLRGVAAVRPAGTVVARDGLAVELPAGSHEIRRRMLD